VITRLLLVTRPVAAALIARCQRLAAHSKRAAPREWNRQQNQARYDTALIW